MTKENKTEITIEDASKAVADALTKSGQALGGEVATDEDPLFAAMMADAEEVADIDDIFEDDAE